MRPIDWRDLLTKERVAFIERGANVKRGEINIKCPFCGSADPSYHMGLNLENGWWACWRNKKGHSGKSPVRLLMALLRIPYWKARELAGLQQDYIDPEGFSAVAARILGRGLDNPQALAEKAPARFLSMPREFQRIDESARCRRHWAYLESRGFDFIGELCEIYNLQMAVSGHWAYRVIIPYEIDHELVTWTGRAIADSKYRYLDLSVDESLVPPKETLYNYDCIADGGRGLLVVEGPVDALKLDFYGAGVDIRAVGLSTNSLTDAQLYMLEEARGQFEWLGVMMDNTPTGIVDSMKIADQLRWLGDVRSIRVPFGKKDGGALSADEAIQFTGDLAS